jgi:hypothetical protein
VISTSSTGSAGPSTQGGPAAAADDANTITTTTTTTTHGSRNPVRRSAPGTATSSGKIASGGYTTPSIKRARYSESPANRDISNPPIVVSTGPAGESFVVENNNGSVPGDPSGYDESVGDPLGGIAEGGVHHNLHGEREESMIDIDDMVKSEYLNEGADIEEYAISDQGDNTGMGDGNYNIMAFENCVVIVQV